VDAFKTIANPAESSVNEQRSKFLAFAIPVHTPEEVKEIVDAYRKKYHDARHVCWAYVLGEDRTQFRFNDDGEPSSTAGKPILGVILSHELTNILILVVRYFGGIKLGTSGLIAAYRSAAKKAIQQAQIVEKTVDEDIALTFDYAALNDVMKAIKEMQAQILSQSVDNTCRIVVRIRRSQAKRFKEQLSGISTLPYTD
jgi:uncharacterized YigZ family protein